MYGSHTLIIKVSDWGRPLRAPKGYGFPETQKHPNVAYPIKRKRYHLILLQSFWHKALQSHISCVPI